MPYPNEHACRLQDPGKYSKFRRGTRSHAGKIYSIIFGIIAPGKSEEQAYRYNKSTWSANEARAHCKSHGGSFEAANGNSNASNYFALVLNALKRKMKGE